MTANDRRREFNQQLDPINWPRRFGSCIAALALLLLVMLIFNIPL